jgi:hypothetical protein
MDPYLEHPALWPDLHLSLIPALREALTPVLRPRYYVAVEARVYIAEPPEPRFVGVPDQTIVVGRTPTQGPNGSRAVDAVDGRQDSGGSQGQEVVPRGGVLVVDVPVPEQVREAYLEVRDPETHQVVTVLEILSPTNKRRGEGREAYLEKRIHILSSRTNLVEIDLLRGGDRMPAWPHGRPNSDPIPGDYRVLVSRSGRRPQADLYPFTVRDPVPAFPLPLRPDDEEPRVDLQTLLRELYDRAAYDLRLNYRAEPLPPLREPDAAWAGDLLRRHGLR